ncbi:LytTR family DNA-binding domain-containing protein [Marinilabiliaceae bacterium ANBcel2]|nr:LytTR family DNA-binding domain-containing protein [Marinilabiliaceae bacterium ANBcel2]
MAAYFKSVPDYFINRKNTFIQVFFTALFAFFFINMYMPFGAGEWYDVSWWLFLLVSALLVTAGMLVVILSRLLLLLYKRKRKRVSVFLYLLMIFAEVFFMGVLYAVLEIVVLGSVRPFGILLYKAVLNTTLILLIPYSISLLFFSWREKKGSLEKLLNQLKRGGRFVPLKDENGVLRYTVKLQDLIYFEASDNYVVIFYYSGKSIKKYLLRNSLKRLEEMFKEYPFLRCHRSYMINLERVKMLKREKGRITLLLDTEQPLEIPVSRSYSLAVLSFFQ